MPDKVKSMVTVSLESTSRVAVRVTSVAEFSSIVLVLKAKAIGAIGQVPQAGLLLSDNGESRLNSDGSELIFVTHQLDISWLNEDASLNIKFILVTLLTSQFEISSLKSVLSLNKYDISVT